VDIIVISEGSDLIVWLFLVCDKVLILNCMCGILIGLKIDRIVFLFLVIGVSIGVIYILGFVLILLCLVNDGLLGLV